MNETTHDLAYQQAPHVPAAFMTRVRVLGYADYGARVIHLTDSGKRLSEPEEIVPLHTLVFFWDECRNRRRSTP